MVIPQDALHQCMFEDMRGSKQQVHDDDDSHADENERIIKDIETDLGFCHSLISNYLNGKRKTAYGYKWTFESEYELIPFKVFDLKIYRKR